MRQRIVAGNWKMNKTLDEAMELAIDLQERQDDFPPEVTVILAPPSLYLLGLEMIEEPCFLMAAQNCSHHQYGAFTGEISAAMLQAMRIKYCIIGHSERREYFHETDELIAKKIDACLLDNIAPIFCCGEKKEERVAKKHFVTVMHQLEKSLFHLRPEQMVKMIIAYEPVWAIGTGLTASTDEAQEMHAFIRKTLAGHFGETIAEKIPILYGGSVSPTNSAALFACPDVDGGLVGGASLKARDFISIIKSAGIQ